MIPAMLVLDIIPEFRLDIIPLDTIPFSRPSSLAQEHAFISWMVQILLRLQSVLDLNCYELLIIFINRVICIYL